MRQSKEDKQKLFDIVVTNALLHNESIKDVMMREKFKAYLPYRKARETLRKQEKFISDLKLFGISALK